MTTPTPTSKYTCIKCGVAIEYVFGSNLAETIYIWNMQDPANLKKLSVKCPKCGNETIGTELVANLK
jgi:predicted RNA-binding Zn-ribbon protein involved in translation (DUF1610 family)